MESGKIGSVGTDCCEGEDEFIRTVSMMTLLLITITSYLESFRILLSIPHVAFFRDQAVSDMVESSVKRVQFCSW
ncbi:MAG: hypothetical protein ACLS9K_10520 [Lachnospira eligens]